MNADPAVMAFFPSLLSRQSSDSSIDLWQSQFSSQGWSNWAVEVLESGQFVGFLGLSIPRRVLPFSPCVEIGWRLAKSFWGHGFATEGGRAALQVAFERIGLSEVVSFTTLGNLRSRAVMERLGLRNALQDFEHPGVPLGHALRLHCLYGITREQWRENSPKPTKECSMPTQDEEIARHLREALASGELAGTEGFGKPLPEDAGWNSTPESLRMPFKILKNAGFVPAEVELLHERAALSASLESSKSEAERVELRRKLSDLQQKIALRLEALRINGAL
jgi:RimJ/RimL family protein N-acetyltransferase